MRALPYVSSGRPSEHIGQPLPALRSSQSSSQVRLIAAKTLAFREPCYRTGPVKAWLVGIARRKAADARRQSRPHVGLEEARQLIDPVRTDDVALRRVELARVIAMTGRLAPDRAEALRLRFFAGLECSEIATVMGRSEAAVKMLVHRALIDLRERLEATT